MKVFRKNGDNLCGLLPKASALLMMLALMLVIIIKELVGLLKPILVQKDLLLNIMVEVPSKFLGTTTMVPFPKLYLVMSKPF